MAWRRLPGGSCLANCNCQLPCLSKIRRSKICLQHLSLEHPGQVKAVAEIFFGGVMSWWIPKHRHIQKDHRKMEFFWYKTHILGSTRKEKGPMNSLGGVVSGLDGDRAGSFTQGFSWEFLSSHWMIASLNCEFSSAFHPVLLCYWTITCLWNAFAFLWDEG